jgi:S-adenosylmethionine:tRNA ribosyltransferase-isomerase
VLHLRAREGGSVAGIEILNVGEGGDVELTLPPVVEEELDRWGDVPLPPYVRQTIDDPERYQTVYAQASGSAAAPTAGLHFTPALLQRLHAGGVGWAEVTLHVGLDTFRPVTEEQLQDHQIHREWCRVDHATADRIAATRASGERVVAIGTTSARTLETLGRHWEAGEHGGFVGPTDIYILPGYRWRIVDALLTNFHLPRTTLLAMVGALAGWDRIKEAYEAAIAERYRFYSFGDAMLIL